MYITFSETAVSVLKSSFFKGMRLSIPLALGFIPIGCSFAVIAMQA